jgi:UDP-glucuronate 4-epimerase
MAPILFADACRLKEGIRVFNHGNQKRDFTYIDDIVENILRITFNKQRCDEKNHEVFNIGNGSPVGLMDFISTLENAFEVSLEKEMVDAQPGDVEVTYADTSKLEQYTGFKPNTSLERGIKEFTSWYKEYYKDN